MKNEKVLNTIEEAIEDFRQGKIVIVVDDEDRENEGDFIIAAEKVTPEIVNFMLKNGRGVLCAPLSEERCAQLELNMMEPNNTSLLGTPFTVTVDLLGEGCTTGVSIHDRAATLRALADPKTKPSDLGRPGHINPLRARQKGVLRRPGHTEAAVDLESGMLDYAVLGLGFNLVQPSGGWPKELAAVAGSLFDSAPAPGARAALAAAFLNEFWALYHTGLRGSWLDDYRRLQALTGRHVTLIPNGSEPRGATVLGIDDDCRLLVRCDGDLAPTAFGSDEIRVIPELGALA